MKKLIFLIIGISFACSSGTQYTKIESNLDRIEENVRRVKANLVLYKTGSSDIKNIDNEIKMIEDIENKLNKTRSQISNARKSCLAMEESRNEYRSKYYGAQFFIWGAIVLLITIGGIWIYFKINPTSQIGSILSIIGKIKQ